MPSKRSNKTARVLNLIAKSDNEPSDIEINAKDIIDSNNNISENAISDLLAKHNNEQNQVNQTISDSTTDSNAVLSDDDISDSLTQNSQEKQIENTQVKPDVREQPSENSAELPPAPQPIVPILQNVREKESQLEDQICSELLSSLELEEQTIKPEPKAELFTEPEKAHESITETDSNAFLSDDAIASLLAEKNSEPEKTSEPTTETDSNAILSDDAITSLLTENNIEPEKVSEPITETDSNTILSDDAIASLLAENNIELEKVNNNPHMNNEAESTQKNNSYFGATAHGKRSVRYINVIQELVEEEAEYSSQMLSCRCPRCMADMKALTLTNLPSKYVVIDDEQKNGLLRIYSSKYSRLISIQMMKSCVIVNENPHH